MTPLAAAQRAARIRRLRHGFTDALPDTRRRVLWCYVSSRHGPRGFGVDVAEDATPEALVAAATKRAAHVLLDKR